MSRTNPDKGTENPRGGVALDQRTTFREGANREARTGRARRCTPLARQPIGLGLGSGFGGVVQDTITMHGVTSRGRNSPNSAPTRRSSTSSHAEVAPDTPLPDQMLDKQRLIRSNDEKPDRGPLSRIRRIQGSRRRAERIAAAQVGSTQVLHLQVKRGAGNKLTTTGSRNRLTIGIPSMDLDADG